MDSEKIKQILKLLDSAEGNLSSARNLLRKSADLNEQDTVVTTDIGDTTADGPKIDASSTIIEGVFNGTEMITSDGKTYPVPANYASKSKLVEGDGLKLTIAEDGSFIYKQISPVERKNVVGTVTSDVDGYGILVDGKKYNILTASITFYKVEPGDTVTAIIPATTDAEWAALENVVKKASENLSTDTDIDSELTEAPSIPSVSDMPEMPNLNETNIEDGDPSNAQQPARETPLSPNPSVVNTESADLDVDELSNSGNTVSQDTLVEETSAANGGNQNDDSGPEIVLPQGNANLSDEEMLENLKKNLQSINTNIPSQDSLSNGQTNPVVPDQSHQNSHDNDKSISELDI